jgi:hypothetical protein
MSSSYKAGTRVWEILYNNRSLQVCKWSTLPPQTRTAPSWPPDLSRPSPPPHPHPPNMAPPQVISWFPRIVYYPSFVDPKRCEDIVAGATKFMGPSGLAYKPGDSVPESQNVRTSQARGQQHWRPAVLRVRMRVKLQ